MNRTLVAIALLLAAATPALAQNAAPEPVMTAVTAGGLVADLYTPANARGRLPAVIVLGGSEGGMGEGAAKEARLIAQHGYAALQLAYFGAPGLPKMLGLIPLEYFGSAIDWLRARGGVDPARIGIVGTSVGGEAALLVGAHYPAIKAVVAGVPSSVVWPGIEGANPNPPSSFTLAGAPLPDLPYGWSGAFISVYDLYRRGLMAQAQHPDAAIPVERIDGPVLLICGEADALWPSCPMARQAAARLKARDFAHEVELLAYADAGHAAFGPPVDPGNPHFSILASLGGSAAGNEAARQDDWPKALAFLDAALKP